MSKLIPLLAPLLQEVYTVWHCLTASLCAIMSDNLPLELLNNPLHIAPEQIPFAEHSAVSATAASGSSGATASTAWLEPARPAVPVVNAHSDEVKSWYGRTERFNTARPQDIAPGCHEFSNAIDYLENRDLRMPNVPANRKISALSCQRHTSFCW